MPGWVVPFALFVLHGSLHVAEVNRNALWEDGDDLGCLCALLTTNGLLGGRIIGYGLHTQQILNEGEFLFGVVVQKAKVSHPPEASGQHMGEKLPNKIFAI